MLCGQLPLVGASRPTRGVTAGAFSQGTLGEATPSVTVAAGRVAKCGASTRRMAIVGMAHSPMVERGIADGGLPFSRRRGERQSAVAKLAASMPWSVQKNALASACALRHLSRSGVARVYEVADEVVAKCVANLSRWCLLIGYGSRLSWPVRGDGGRGP
jgi:hypothetical protein